MLCWNSTARRGAWLLALALLIPAGAGAEFYAWRTDDGVFAYADAREKIPARYAERAVRVSGKRLVDYDRLTLQDSAAQQAVGERLRHRLAYLRALNHGDHVAAEGRTQSAPTVTVATGSPQAPTLDVPASEGDGPVVVETVLGKAKGDLVTRSTTVISQGDRTLAVIKGRRNTHNLSTDILDLDEIDQ